MLDMGEGLRIKMYIANVKNVNYVNYSDEEVCLVCLVLQRQIFFIILLLKQELLKSGVIDSRHGAESQKYAQKLTL